MDENPYSAPQAGYKNVARTVQPTHSPKRGAIIGAITGGLPIPLMAIYVVIRDQDLSVLRTFGKAFGMSVALALLGAVVGAGIVAVARRLQSRDE